MYTLTCVYFFFSSVLFRPYIFTGSLVMLAIFGMLNGYVTSRFNKLFGVTDWRSSAVLSAVVFPSVMFMCFGIEDAIDMITGSSAATPLYKAVGYSLLWMLIDAPMCFLGAYAGSQTPLGLVPNVSEEASKIPRQPCYNRSWLIVPFFGALAFACFGVQVKYILDSEWRQQMIYGLFSVLLLNLVLLFIVLAIFAVLVTYL